MNQAARAKARFSAGLDVALIMELCRLRPDDLTNHFARNMEIVAERLDRHLSRKIRQTNFGDRLHNQHLELGPLRNQGACVDPYPRGPDWMLITPKTGSLFHADSHRIVGFEHIQPVSNARAESITV